MLKKIKETKKPETTAVVKRPKSEKKKQAERIAIGLKIGTFFGVMGMLFLMIYAIWLPADHIFGASIISFIIMIISNLSLVRCPHCGSRLKWVENGDPCPKCEEPIKF